MLGDNWGTEGKGDPPMSNLFLVFSSRPPDVSARQFDEFYSAQLRTNIQVEGFVRARRYTANEVVDRRETGVQQHLAAYEYEGEMATWQRQHAHLFDSGKWPLPDWFAGVGFSTWNCNVVEDWVYPDPAARISTSDPTA